MIVADTTTPVVVLHAYTHCALTVIRSLGRLGVPVYAVHNTRKAPALRSKYCRGVFELSIEDTPRDAAVEALLRIAETVGEKPLLISTEDASCVFVEDNAAALRQAYRFAARPEGLAQSLSSKQAMYYLCQRLDIPTPETVFPESRADVVRFAETATFPLMVKPVDNRDATDLPGAGKTAVSTAAELLRVFDQFASSGAVPKLVLQEYIPGGAESVWMFNGYFNAQSDCLFAVTGQKLRQYPPYVGQASLGICQANPVVEATTRRFMHALRYTGILDIGYRYDARDGKYKLLDVNPRIGASFRLFVDDNGLDVARALYLDLTDQPVPTGGVTAHRKWFVENYDLLASLKYRRDGRLTARDWFTSFHGVREAAWFATDDPRPFGAMSVASVLYLARTWSRSRTQRSSWTGTAPETDQHDAGRSPMTTGVLERGELEWQPQ